MIEPSANTTFAEYANNKILPYISEALATVARVDVVFDVYIRDSLKLGTREKRGKGVRRKIADDVKIPSNWKSFLRVDENKTELFAYLAHKVSLMTTEKVVVATCRDGVLITANATVDCSTVAPTNQEEADSRIFLHVQNAVNSGCENVIIRTVDTDVVAIALSCFSELNAKELWVAFGTGSNFRMIPIHSIHQNIGRVKSSVMHIFHAITGCDTVSFFYGKKKKTMWETWTVYPELTGALLSISMQPNNVSDDVMKIVERFIVIAYDRTSDLRSVDALRKRLYCKHSRMLDIPPTSAALSQHVKRAAYQAGHIWAQCTSKQVILPSPGDWGWQKESEDGPWQPKWTTLRQAQDECMELISCKCKKSCSGRCGCRSHDLKCTQLCICDGKCYKDDE